VLTSVLIQDTNFYSSSNLIGSVFNWRFRGQDLSTVLESEGLTTAICYCCVCYGVRDPCCNG